MKRYQCIKTIKEDPTGLVSFTAGKVYTSDTFHILDDKWVCLTNNFESKNYFTGSFLKEFFKELDEDLPIPRMPYEDPDATDEYWMSEPRGCHRTGIAICIAAMITIGFIIYKIIIWNS